LLFPRISAKPVVLEVDQRQGFSDGGAVLLKAAERCYGLIASTSGCLRDPRQAGKEDHSCGIFSPSAFSSSAVVMRTPMILLDGSRSHAQDAA
jgi:hypothetical protein